MENKKRKYSTKEITTGGSVNLTRVDDNFELKDLIQFDKTEIDSGKAKFIKEFEKDFVETFSRNLNKNYVKFTSEVVDNDEDVCFDRKF